MKPHDISIQKNEHKEPHAHQHSTQITKNIKTMWQMKLKLNMQCLCGTMVYVDFHAGEDKTMWKHIMDTKKQTRFQEEASVFSLYTEESVYIFYLGTNELTLIGMIPIIHIVYKKQDGHIKSNKI